MDQAALGCHPDVTRTPGCFRSHPDFNVVVFFLCEVAFLEKWRSCKWTKKRIGFQIYLIFLYLFSLLCQRNQNSLVWAITGEKKNTDLHKKKKEMELHFPQNNVLCVYKHMLAHTHKTHTIVKIYRSGCFSTDWIKTFLILYTVNINLFPPQL